MSGAAPGNARARGPLALALAGHSTRRVFAPYLWALAEQRSGRTAADYGASASVMVNALQAARQLVEADAIHVLLDATSGAAFDALKRLGAMSRSHDLVAVLPGPVALAAMRDCALDDAQEDFEDLARAALEAGCDVLAMREPQPDERCADSVRAVARLAAFYGARTLALAPQGGAFVLAEGFDALDSDDTAPCPHGIAIAPARAGVPLPVSTIVSSSLSTPADGSDADWLRASARQLRNDSRE